MDISIIIVSWNTRDLLKKCIKSILKHTQKKIKFEIIVVDNASQDGTVEMLWREFPEVKVLANNQNFGFAKANNQAIAKAQGKYVLLLNPDTEFTEDTLKPIAQKMDADESIGVLGCRLLNSDGTLQPSVRRFPRKRDILVILFKLDRIFPKLLDHYLARDFSYTQPPPNPLLSKGGGVSMEQVHQVMGAFFLVRREVFEKIGLLDEEYFIWFEEVDFCRRVWQNGWKVVYYPNISIVHHSSKSFAQAQTWKKQLWFFQSAWRYFS